MPLWYNDLNGTLSPVDAALLRLPHPNPEFTSVIVRCARDGTEHDEQDDVNPSGEVPALPCEDKRQLLATHEKLEDLGHVFHLLSGKQTGIFYLCK